ncbi:trimethyllysine dioxygenase [Emydomyces testavorans]|uniref:Trimethyllysine dioxygenase n=1 Tax=Emydomyces testavorans TaxID=2070801 RepID=A0AAF0IFV5_9EURO|nr:trimethyllysine dioxygenase [Emydomyces testavorans]
MKDMAYTTEALPVHTDTAYFTDAAGLQMFHLLSHTGGDGGETLLVDGFEAARILHTEKKDAYYALKHPIFSHHASGNKDICIRPGGGFPTFSHRTYTGELYQVRWNNEDRGAATSAPISTLERWYFAAREWSELLKRPSLVRQFKLEPGTPLSTCASHAYETSPLQENRY